HPKHNPQTGHFSMENPGHFSVEINTELFAALMQDGEPLVPDVETQPKTRQRKAYQRQERRSGRPSSRLRARSNAAAIRTIKRDMTGALNPAS
ncbi:hypothetical protein LL251_20255, partial [Sphingobium naphthae]|nr:hypothetical protein [Sphingobium naphthae]